MHYQYTSLPLTKLMLLKTNLIVIKKKMLLKKYFNKYSKRNASENTFHECPKVMLLTSFYRYA